MYLDPERAPGPESTPIFESVTGQLQDETTPDEVRFADHFHSGKDCAHCLAEVQLVPRRVDYARLRFSMIEETHEMSESEMELVREACERLAERLLREWSFTESRPLLPAEKVVQAEEKEILAPVLRVLRLRNFEDI